jgi:predicted TIM-barrel fold metal-dependent hydrolase
MSTAEDLIEAMNQTQVSKAVVMGMGWANREVAREANDYILESASKYPERLIGFCSVNPAWGAEAMLEVERCARGGAKGIGELHPDTQDFDITQPADLAPLMAWAKGQGIPVVVHSSEPVGHQYPGKGATTPEKLFRFIENFPDNTIICAHWGGGLPFYELMPEVPEVLKNVYYDMAASPFLYGPQVVDTVAGLVGPDKILFGTDYPLIKPQRMLRYLEASGISPEAQSAIRHGNAARLLGL